MSSVSVPGKIILSGEYAVLFGYPGIAVPAQQKITLTWEPSPTLSIKTSNHPAWQQYVQSVIDHAWKLTNTGEPTGTVTIETDLPIGKGMGSSTAVVVAVCTALELDESAMKGIEDAVNPGNSGLDLAVISRQKPVLFKKGSEPQEIDLSTTLLNGSGLIDTGMPDQSTPELVAWVTERRTELEKPLSIIGQCTERIVRGEDMTRVIRDHHRAQVALGVVPEHVQDLIAVIEKNGGSAKVLGAGARTGGGGMVLQLQ